MYHRVPYFARLGALLAPTAMGLDVVVEVRSAIVVGEFFAGGDFSLGADVDLLCLLVDLGIAVGTTGVVDVPCDIGAVLAIENKVPLKREEILPATAVCLVVTDSLSRVLDDEIIFGSGNGGEEAEACACTFHYHTCFGCARCRHISVVV